LKSKTTPIEALISARKVVDLRRACAGRRPSGSSNGIPGNASGYLALFSSGLAAASLAAKKEAPS
jgi:hypothetical protein